MVQQGSHEVRNAPPARKNRAALPTCGMKVFSAVEPAFIMSSEANGRGRSPSRSWRRPTTRPGPDQRPRSWLKNVLDVTEAGSIRLERHG